MAAIEPGCTFEPRHIFHEVEVLKRQVKTLRNTVARQGELLDLLASPLYKRIYWFLMGFKFYKIGRWYGKDKENWS